MSRRHLRATPRTLASAMLVGALTILSLPALAAGAGPAPAALATNLVAGAPSTLTVNSLGTAPDASPGDGICATGATVDGAPECTLRAALQEANAVDLTAGDAPSSITIDFSATGLFSINNADAIASRMFTGTVGVLWGNMGLGATFVIDSPVPVTVDLGNLDGIEHANDTVDALFYVRSDDVVIRNAATMRAGEAAIAVEGSRVDIENVTISDETTANLEVGVGLLDGASDVTVSSSSIVSAAFVGVLVDSNATVGDIVLDDVVSRGHSRAHVDVEDGATVDGLTIRGSQVGRPEESAPSPHVFLNPNVDVTGLQLLDTRFESPNQIGVGVYGGGVTLTDTVIDGSTFNGTGIAFQDGGAAIVNGLDVTDSVFAGVLGKVLNLELTRASDVQITGNLFSDERGNSAATIHVGYVSDDSTIASNRFIQGENTDRNRWAVFNGPRDAAAGVDTGWSIVDNFIDGYQGATDGPIRNTATGDTFTARNEFGPDTTGTTLEESENGTRFFVFNAGTANGPIQTWRPVASAVGNGRLAVEVAPVEPLPRNVASTSPVDIDVYWTASDNAEEYVGTIEDVTGPVVRVFDFPETGGFVRVQTHDADGRSSQYSATTSVVEDEVAPEAPVVEAAPAEGPVTGTGEPGATVVIRDDAGDEVASGEVGGDGAFSVDLDEPLTCDVEYSVTQVDFLGNESEPTSFQADDCPGNGGGDGTGNGGGDGTDVGAGDGTDGGQGAGGILPDAGASAGLLALLLAGLAAIGLGGFMARHRVG